ncbi:hypothetical protein OROGR_002013 [Orobanche gracilis]
MGKKLDALLGRGFKTAKFKATVALAISRLAVLKNQRQARCSIARSDVVQFLQDNNHDRAILRVEQVMKEQNMLDVFVLVEGYCHLLLERVNLIEHERICPEELHEAVSSLIYAATRCGEFPELQEIRSIFTSRFGREFAARAIELRNNCGVNPKVIQKLSTRKPSLENKMKLIKEIASDNNIDLPIENTAPVTKTENKELGQERQMPVPTGPLEVFHQEESISFHPHDIDRSVRRKYKDVAEAAQVAFESAAYAAAAARAAVELSRFDSINPDGSPHTPGPGKSEYQTHEEYTSEDEQTKSAAKYEKIHPVPNCDCEIEKGMEQLKANEDVIVTEFKRSHSETSPHSSDGDVTVDESDGEDGIGAGLKMGGAGRTSTELSNINRRPVSVRTRKAH